MPKSLTTSRNVTSVCHFRVTRPKNHLFAMSPHQGRGRKLPDIFTLDDEHYLGTVDYYSGYFEVDQLHSKTGTVTTKKLGDILSYIQHLMNC